MPLFVGIQARRCRRAGNSCAKNARAPRAQRIDEGTDGRVFYGQGNDFNNLSSENASALGSLDTILSSLQIIVSHKAAKNAAAKEIECAQREKNT